MDITCKFGAYSGRCWKFLIAVLLREQIRLISIALYGLLENLQMSRVPALGHTCSYRLKCFQLY